MRFGLLLLIFTVSAASQAATLSVLTKLGEIERGTQHEYRTSKIRSLKAYRDISLSPFAIISIQAENGQSCKCRMTNIAEATAFFTAVNSRPNVNVTCFPINPKLRDDLSRFMLDGGAECALSAELD